MNFAVFSRSFFTAMLTITLLAGPAQAMDGKKSKDSKEMVKEGNEG